jgi:hypothetical protein
MKKLIAGTLVTTASIASAGLAIHIAPVFMWQFVYDLKLPMTALFALTGLVSSVVIPESRNIMQRKGTNKYSEDFVAAEWRVWTTVNVLVIMGIAWLLVMGIPKPDFNKQTVFKEIYVTQKVPVIKYAGIHEVYKAPTYAEAFKLCTDAVVSGTPEVDKQAEICHKQALLAALPDDRKLLITRVVHDADNYSGLFKQCMDQWDIKSISIPEILAVTNTCKSYALRKAN